MRYYLRAVLYIFCIKVLGGIDRGDYSGNIWYTPMTKSFSILLTNMSVDGIMIPLECSEVSKTLIVAVMTVIITA